MLMSSVRGQGKGGWRERDIGGLNREPTTTALAVE